MREGNLKLMKELHYCIHLNMLQEIYKEIRNIYINKEMLTNIPS